MATADTPPDQPSYPDGAAKPFGPAEVARATADSLLAQQEESFIPTPLEIHHLLTLWMSHLTLWNAKNLSLPLPAPPSRSLISIHAIVLSIWAAALWLPPKTY